MSDHLTEEEQIENLKRLWKEYGTSVIASVVVASAGYFGWNYWQGAEQRKAEIASEYYEQILVAAQSDAAAEGEAEAAGATVDHLAGQIRDTKPDSFYAAQGAFFSAKKAVESGNLEQAVSELEWVLANVSDPALLQIARLRLARVQAELGEFAAASEQLSGQPLVGFESEHAEVQGDVLRLSGDKAAALTAYEKALEKFAGANQQRQVVLQMKIDNVKPESALEEPSA
ncbi:tetratricopeptide repeat protein [Gilvimarinus sp. SDUM040013]|uniref:Ancillary SecYEG translocon subunit n=1 Tax=Gilvimarinus gilvus TaxID=3058038 RepID=A0ABU4RW56_9GAMM|nr:tetratricopeptide repeat protein [Gilvimarinus sp. SDUM040013]MDO3385121.1 tetratricopeptide repeat protein [Gilvimarinus sp. SDUM040013]MDX6848496.1 tetratricopeptide repeat protein [Gilvimarinus sp. SDUM040013]